MTQQSPVLDIFIGTDRAAWRLYVAPHAWCPPMLRDHLEAFPVAEPDLAELDRHTWANDAPYEKRVTKTGDGRACDPAIPLGGTPPAPGAARRRGQVVPDGK